MQTGTPPTLGHHTREDRCVSMLYGPRPCVFVFTLIYNTVSGRRGKGRVVVVAVLTEPEPVPPVLPLDHHFLSLLPLLAQLNTYLTENEDDSNRDGQINSVFK